MIGMFLMHVLIYKIKSSWKKMKDLLDLLTLDLFHIRVKIYSRYSIHQLNIEYKRVYVIYPSTTFKDLCDMIVSSYCCIFNNTAVENITLCNELFSFDSSSLILAAQMFQFMSLTEQNLNCKYKLFQK